MLDHLFRHPRVRARLRANPLGAWIEAYVAYLGERGHPLGTIQSYVQAVEHFGVWVASEHIAIDAVTQTSVDSFLLDHLPVCRCPTPAPTCLHQVRAALTHLLRVPSGHPPRSQPASPLTPVDVALGHYRTFLLDTCGLAESTCVYRIRHAHEFLRGKFGDGPVSWGMIRPEDLMAFIAGYAARCRTRTAQVAASSLRTLLRFLQLQGDCEPALMAAVPCILCWRLDHLPRTMSDEQLCRFLACFDRSTPTGRRDYAMVLCQVDLGLRVSEVSDLRIEDVHWREAILRIEGGKIRRIELRTLSLSANGEKNLELGLTPAPRPELVFRSLHHSTEPWGGLDWTVGFFLFVILVAVGEDYNILLMARVIEKEDKHGITEGTRLAVAHTGGIIGSCGLIMAGTFGSMLTGTLTSLRELGFALGLGILLDTFLVRPILVPAFVIVMDRYRAARWVEASQKAPVAAPVAQPDGNLFEHDKDHTDGRLKPEAIDSCLGQFYEE